MQIIPLLKRNEYTLSMLPMVDTKVDVAYSMYTLLPIRADSSLVPRRFLIGKNMG